MQKTILFQPLSLALALALVVCGITPAHAYGAVSPGGAASPGPSAGPAVVSKLTPPPSGAPPHESRPITGRSLEIPGGRPFINYRSMNVLLAMGGAALVAKTTVNDARLAEALRVHPFEQAIEPGDFFGDGRTAGFGALGLYAAGRLAHNERLTAAGGDLCKSLLVTWSAVWALKALVNEQRPLGGDYSFPSGHTATAFATASVLAAHFGPYVAVPAYALATTTALARVEDRRHYLADVLFGAAIGYVVGSEIGSRGKLALLSDHLAVTDRAVAVKLSF